ncbi:hypothetical protein AXA44_24760 [Rhodococcus sp. SC4]|nr:hypothetical protein AXA44_24760 [Rhodococcus sp. SC4]
MVTCGGQATIPIVAVVSRVTPVAYAEIVASIASKSAGPATRANIDEFTETTSHVIETVGGARRGKAIIVLNPADPPAPDPATPDAVRDSIQTMVDHVATYVPGYRLKQQVQTAHYLPAYAGNLDIMTSAAVRYAESVAETMPKPHPSGTASTCAPSSSRSAAAASPADRKTSSSTSHST